MRLSLKLAVALCWANLLAVPAAMANDCALSFNVVQARTIPAMDPSTFPLSGMSCRGAELLRERLFIEHNRAVSAADFADLAKWKHMRATVLGDLARHEEALRKALAKRDHADAEAIEIGLTHIGFQLLAALGCTPSKIGAIVCVVSIMANEATTIRALAKHDNGRGDVAAAQQALARLKQNVENIDSLSQAELHQAQTTYQEQSERMCAIVRAHCL